MSGSLKTLLVALFLLAQFFLVWWLNHENRASADLGAEKALKNYGFYLRDVAKESGIDFVHHMPQKLDEKVQHIAPIIAGMGAGVAVADFDKDGHPDLYVVNSGEDSKNALYRNLGNGKFENVADKLGLADLNREGAGVCQGAVWGDYDGDGYEDLLVYKWGKPELFRNLAGKAFENVSSKVGLPAWVNTNSAIWVDYNRDGKLDLLIAGYWADDLDLWNLKTSKIMPSSFEYAKNGGRKYLLRNKGDGTFEDVTEKVGLRSTRWTLATIAVDLCGSGYPDIVFANDYGVSEYFCNRKGERFEEIGQHTGIGQTPKSGMNASLGDPFNSGKLSLYVSNITVEDKLQQGNNLWVPNKHKRGEPAKYLNLAGDLKLDRGGWSWAAQFGDLNNDGFQELFLTNGYVSADPKNSYWYEYSKIAGGLEIIIDDAKNWPAMKGRSLAGYERKYLWWNRGGEFSEVAAAVGVKETFDGRAVALVDLWGRGVLDVVVANQGGPLLVYKNTADDSNQWVQFDLTGSDGNTFAIGALVRVFWKTQSSPKIQEQVQAVTGGMGYASQNMRRLHFGLGKEAEIEKVEITWPSGQEQTLTNVKINQVHKIKEPTR
jgi:hypothetical protein